MGKVYENDWRDIQEGWCRAPAGATKGTAMKISGVVAVLAIAIVASLIGTPYFVV
ncbi:MAG: hypothetical protein ACR2KT_06285 [Methylocella sp.]